MRTDDSIIQPGTPDGRTLHYGTFYGVDAPATDDRPLLVVWGNCQAEALRIVLDTAQDRDFRTVRVPPVHELTADDMPHVRRILGQAGTVVSQPVRAGYRGLPIGTTDLASMTQASTIVWPVIRYGGLYPFQVIVRHPDDPSAVPPAVPYHDLRTILAVRDGRARFDEWDVEVTPDQLRAAAQWSVDQLEFRERRDTDVAISDVLLALGAAAAHTINHPGNGVLIELGTRILAALGTSGPTPVDRDLLGNVRTPLERRVIEALGLSADERAEWAIDGQALSQRDIHGRQMEWYAEHDGFVEATMTRYRDLIDILGLPT